MKLMIASDIHGSALYCRAMLDAFERENAQRLILLGDILYHGPRNDLPDGYAPKQVIALLNPLREKLMCVRGNCEAEVDQMVLDFPVLADYALMALGERMIYITHGHLHGEDNPPPLCPGDILLCGHTHVARLADHAGFTYMNPGSVSLPKQDTPRSYMTLDNGEFTWKRLDDGQAYMHRAFVV